MLPVKLTIKGIGPYVDETIDFQGIPGDVVAIVGENGAGKTFLVDCMYAALYRSFPYRSDFYKYCKPKAQITFDFRMGPVAYRSIINIDSKKREMEPWLQVLVGSEYKPLTDGKNTTFDKEIERVCGAGELILSSVYAAQEKKGSFITLQKAKRKELFIDMLGLGKLQVISDRAGDQEKISKEAYDKLSAKAEAYRIASVGKTVDLSALRGKIDQVREEVSTAEADLKLNTFEVGLLKAKFQGVKDIEARQFPVHKRKISLGKEIAEVNKAISDSEVLVAGIDGLNEVAGGLDEATAQYDRTLEEISTLMVQQSDHHKQLASYNLTVRGLEAQAGAQKQIIVATTGILKRGLVDAAIIDRVPCKARDECAECEFLVNAIKARGILGDQETKIDEATAATLAIEDQIKAIPRPEAKTLNQIEAQLLNTRARSEALESKVVAANAAWKKLVKAQGAADILQDLQVRRTKLQSDYFQVESEKNELDAALKVAKESEAELRSAEKKLELDQEALDGSRQHLNILLAEVTRAETEIEHAKKAQAELDTVLPVLSRLDQDRKSWNLLAKAFGKTGIQSLEIDASGPAVSEIVNDLLLSCFGPRFSIKFVTQVLKDDKSGYKDDFDIYVVDAENEREGSIDDLSGGEKVIICEAVALAIALYNRSRASVGWVSLFRDEASSAVDDRRAPLYIRMLRRAREQGHFEKLFFIAHQQRVTEGADSKVVVTDGHVALE